MVENTFVMLVKEIGLPLTSLAIVGGFCGWLIKDDRKKGDKREDRFWEFINDQTITLNKVSQVLTTIEESNRDAHKYQRDEHREMITVLTRLNGKGP